MVVKNEFGYYLRATEKVAGLGTRLGKIAIMLKA